jgi:ferric-dicitrate binding protein FerR (iron transport regulator)
VTTPAGAAVDLKTAGGEASLAVRAGSRLVVDRATCGGNPRVTVTAGSVQAVARDPLEVNAGAARSTGRAATWTVQAAGGRATIAVTRGTVTVRGRAGGAVVVKAGQRTVVTGKGAPTAP